MWLKGPFKLKNQSWEAIYYFLKLQVTEVYYFLGENLYITIATFYYFLILKNGLIIALNVVFYDIIVRE